MDAQIINNFLEAVRAMREAQKAYFKARKDPNSTPQLIWSLLEDSRKKEEKVDKFLENENPNEPKLF
ncbi:MAG: hypothetical protein MJY49_03110 [Bacteroidales bacterium]|nr:hypothetical protein [Bacteroidales bacterium]